MADEPLRLSSIGQIAQPVTDLGRAVDFYRETLGGTLIQQPAFIGRLPATPVEMVTGQPSHQHVSIAQGIDQRKAPFRHLQANPHDDRGVVSDLASSTQIQARVEANHVDVGGPGGDAAARQPGNAQKQDRCDAHAHHGDTDTSMRAVEPKWPGT